MPVVPAAAADPCYVLVPIIRCLQRIFNYKGTVRGCVLFVLLVNMLSLIASSLHCSELYAGQPVVSVITITPAV